jgi:membrane-anchored glycerophosphoryl diester phosphodiesterase (GDPDase)
MTKWEKTKQAIKPYLTWKMFISLIVAWLIFLLPAGICLVIGIMIDNAWLYGIGTAYIAWVIFPNGSFMIPLTMSIPIHKFIFGKKPNIELNKGEK